MKLNLLSINAISTVIQLVTVTVTLAILYRILATEVGVDNIGVWSLVMSMTALGKLGEVGLGTAIMRTCSEKLGSNHTDQIKPLLLAALLLVLTVVAAIVLISYPLIQRFLAMLIDDEDKLATGLALLPYALAAMYGTSVATICYGLLDAFQLSWLKSLYIAIASVVHVVLAAIFIPRHGVIGLAVLQVLQALLLLLMCFATCVWALRTIDSKWNLPSKNEFTNLLKFGGGMQLNLLMQLLFDPTTKALTTHFGGVTATGFYEIANRAIFQLKSIITSVYQLLIPYISHRFPGASQTPSMLASSYKATFTSIQLAIAVFLPVLFAAIPLVIPVWVENSSELLLSIAFVCALGWSFNLLGMPAYLYSLIVGKVKWTVECHFYIGILNLVFGVTGGLLFGPLGVVCGTMLALAMGSFSVYFRANPHIIQRSFMPFSQVALVLLGINTITVYGWHKMANLIDSSTTNTQLLAWAIFPLLLVLVVVEIGLIFKNKTLQTSLFPEPLFKS